MKGVRGMENVKFLRIEEKNGLYKLYFKIHDRLAEYIRENTKFEVRRLHQYLTEDNLFCYTISPSNNFEELQQTLINTIEKISNEKDDVYLFNHIITDNGFHKPPSKIHDLMRTEYGLADINEDEDENINDKDIDLEWWTAHFFISFGNILFYDSYGHKDDSIYDEKATVSIVPSKDDISEFMRVLKSIDKIVVVDDARMIGPKDLNSHK